MYNPFLLAQMLKVLKSVCLSCNHVRHGPEAQKRMLRKLELLRSKGRPLDALGLSFSEGIEDRAKCALEHECENDPEESYLFEYAKKRPGPAAHEKVPAKRLTAKEHTA